ncbi:hypothetical protein J437_LFUL019529, partial [Ladona fulva]
EVNNIITQVKSKKSNGVEYLAAFVIKEANITISKVFAFVDDLSMQTGVFPDQLKTAIVIPIFNEGDINNYRPISLLPVDCRERLLPLPMIQLLVMQQVT